MRQTPYYVFDTDEFAKRAAMIRLLLIVKEDVGYHFVFR